MAGGPAVELGRPEVMVDGASLNAARTHLGFTSQATDRPAEAYAAEVGKLVAAVQVSRAQSLPEADFGQDRARHLEGARRAGPSRVC